MDPLESDNEPTDNQLTALMMQMVGLSEDLASAVDHLRTRIVIIEESLGIDVPD